jgi:ABC-type multidrug transport system permease subunit
MPSFTRRLLDRLPLIAIAAALVAFWTFVILWLFGVV